MESTAIKRPALDTMYQNKLEEIYPEVMISAKSVSSLRRKEYNALFPMKVVARVVGINEGEGNEIDYRLEIREVEILEKPTEEQSPGELKETIEQKIEEEQ